MRNMKQQLEKRTRRAGRSHARTRGTAAHPRLSVFRSSKYLYAQLIDDVNHITLVSGSTRGMKKEKKTKAELASLLGADIAKKAKEKGISNAVFDRGGYKFHGRVSALAEAVRKAGLTV